MGFFRLGQTDAFSVSHFLYYAGFPVILYKAFAFGKAIRLQNVILNANMNVNPIYRGGFVETSKGILLGLLYLIVVSVIWKFICELMLILFRYLESNTKKAE